MALAFYVLLLFGIFEIVGSEDIPEFQYPCYVDICTFPTQFCNSDRFERRCSPCTKAICKESKVPLACKYICGKYEKPTTTTATTTAPIKRSESSYAESSTNGYCESSVMLLAYSSVSTTLIVILIILFWICHMRQQSKLDKETNILRNQKSYKSGLVQDEEQQKSLLADAAARLEDGRAFKNNGGQLAAGDSPPSYTTSGDQNEENAEGTPVQATASGLNGNHRQVCSGYTTNPSPDGDEGQHHKPWSLTGARPKTNNNNNNQSAQLLTQTQQPESAANLAYASCSQTLNNASEMAQHRNLASGDGQRSIVVGNAERRENEPEEVTAGVDEDSVSEETSLKS